ncbi:MAG: MFS transporter [Propionivibrio sp.]|uniref:MFS transporter n=1 Tax=Propionivibrio sp. TaxID=2212460 RepID=UPI001A62472F|nr:MFS transporter [Propionivibrio sp.]MBL8415135.1 MFS transporter [Propionivibrio sp.]
MLWIRLFLPFAGAYFLSYLFRTANAVIGPVLSDELTLGAADLGLLTSAYFLAFGAAQLPLGVLLDRFGPRRVEAALLLIAAGGAAIFACGHGIVMLAFGRGMIGLGVSACLMAAFKSFSQWFPLERQASLTGWIMTSGTLGALAASAPLNAALNVATWRDIFFVLSGLTVAVSAWLYISVPDKPVSEHPEPLSVQLAGVRQVLVSRHFWRFAPLGFAQIGGFMAVQSLWSSAWLMHVNGHTRSLAADHLAAMSMAMVVAYILIGLLATGLARRGIAPIYLLGGGMVMSLLTLLLIITQAIDRHYVLWMAFGVFSCFGTLAYSQMSAGFPVALSGRANSTLNLMVFLGAFGLQWGMGVLIDMLQASGLSTAIAHRNAFAVLFVLQAIAVWILIGGRQTSAKAD